MRETPRISRTQAYLLLTTTTFSTAVALVPEPLFLTAGRSAPWSVLLATLLALPVGWLVHSVGRRFSGKTVPQYLEFALGRPLGKLLSLAYLATIAWLVVCCLFQFGILVQLSIMPATPIAVFLLMGLVLVLYLAWGGIEVIARVNQIMLPFSLAVMTAVYLLAVGNAETGWLRPVLPYDWETVLNGSFYPLSFVGQVYLVGMWLPFVEKRDEALGSILRGAALGGLLLLLSVLIILATFGPFRAADLLNPVLEMMKEIHYGAFVNRLEVIGVPVWIALIIVKAGLGFFDVSLGLSQVLGLRDHRVLSLFLVPAFALLPFHFHGLWGLFRFLLHYWVDVLFPFGALLPVLPYTVALIRRLPR